MQFVMMPVFFFGKIVAVGVLVGKRVRVGGSVVGVGDGMGVQVGVAAFQGVDHNLGRARDHHRQRDQVQGRQLFPQKREGKRRPDEGGHRVIGAGLRRAEGALGPDVEENAEPVGHEAQNEGRPDPIAAGNSSPRSRAMARAPKPEKTPFRMTIS